MLTAEDLGGSPVCPFCVSPVVPVSASMLRVSRTRKDGTTYMRYVSRAAHFRHGKDAPETCPMRFPGFLTDVFGSDATVEVDGEGRLACQGDAVVVVPSDATTDAVARAAERAREAGYARVFVAIPEGSLSAVPLPEWREVTGTLRDRTE